MKETKAEELTDWLDRYLATQSELELVIAGIDREEILHWRNVAREKMKADNAKSPNSPNANSITFNTKG